MYTTQNVSVFGLFPARIQIKYEDLLFVSVIELIQPIYVVNLCFTPNAGK